MAKSHEKRKKERHITWPWRGGGGGRNLQGLRKQEAAHIDVENGGQRRIWFFTSSN